MTTAIGGESARAGARATIIGEPFTTYDARPIVLAHPDDHGVGRPSTPAGVSDLAEGGTPS